MIKKSKLFCLSLLFPFCFSCINERDEKAILLSKKLGAVSLLSTASDSLLYEMETLSPHQRVEIILNLSSRDGASLLEIEKLERLLYETLSFSSKKETKSILQKLIAIYQRLDLFRSPDIALKGLNLCKELETQYSLSKEEDWYVREMKAKFLNKQGSYKESILILYDLLEEHRDAEKVVHVIQDLYAIATYFIRLGDIEKGLALFKEAYLGAVADGVFKKQFTCLSSVINASFNLQRYNDVVDICDTVNLDSISQHISSIYSILAKSYLHLQKPDSARIYLAQMKKKTRKGVGMIYFCQMAETFISENREDSAAFYLNKAIEAWTTVGGSQVQKRKKLPLYFMYVYPSYASLLQRNGKLQEAGEAFQFVEPLMKASVSEQERLEKQIDALGRYGSFCQFTKQYEKATELLIYRDSIQKVYYENKISLDSKHWVDRFEIQELTNKNEKQQEEINNAKRILAIIVTASFIILCFSAITAYLFKKYRKQNKELRAIKAQEMQLVNTQSTLPKKREPLTSQKKLFNAAKKIVESQKIFLNNALTLEELARILDTNRSTLSSCINVEAGINFNQWINNYRIDYAKTRIIPTTNLRNLYAEAGFKSYNTFNSSFKERLGCTPGEYKMHKYDEMNL